MNITDKKKLANYISKSREKQYPLLLSLHTFMLELYLLHCYLKFTKYRRAISLVITCTCFHFITE